MRHTGQESARTASTFAQEHVHLAAPPGLGLLVPALDHLVGGILQPQWMPHLEQTTRSELSRETHDRGGYKPAASYALEKNPQRASGAETATLRFAPVALRIVPISATLRSG